MKRIELFFAAVIAAVFFTGCYTNPETGRSYAVLTSLDQERQLGEQAFGEVKSKERISTDPAANARVRRIGERIARSVGDRLPGAKWEFVVFESKELNAFALPGGKVGVYSGLLALATTDDELAVVMGHEIGHAVARHGAKRMTENFGVAALGMLGGAYVDKKYGADRRDQFFVAYGGLSTVLVVLPHSRGDESEADFMGLRYAAQAGYDPSAAVIFWQKMAAANKSSTPSWLRTHPTDVQRIAAIKAQLPEVMPIYHAAKQRVH